MHQRLEPHFPRALGKLHVCLIDAGRRGRQNFISTYSLNQQLLSAVYVKISLGTFLVMPCCRSGIRIMELRSYREPIKLLVPSSCDIPRARQRRIDCSNAWMSRVGEFRGACCVTLPTRATEPHELLEAVWWSNGERQQVLTNPSR